MIIKYKDSTQDEKVPEREEEYPTFRVSPSGALIILYVTPEGTCLYKTIAPGIWHSVTR